MKSPALRCVLSTRPRRRLRGDNQGSSAPFPSVAAIPEKQHTYRFTTDPTSRGMMTSRASER